MGQVSTPSTPVRVQRDWKRERELQKKSWADASIEEKIEKIRIELLEMRYLKESVSGLSTQLNELMQHSHSENGVVVVPIQRIGYLNSVGKSGNQDNLA